VVVEVAEKAPRTQRRHLVIAGTGRAGNSFLVQFLGASGLDVGTDHAWAPRARAGSEHYLLDDGAPYVVKDPWLFAYCNEINFPDITIDALIVPMRELMAAATSRIFQERMALAESVWRNRPLTDVAASTAGGVVYSLDPIDQARVLAVGFYQLLHWAVLNEIPLVLLEFPRLVENSDYLIETLWPWLEPYCTVMQAKEAFRTTALASSVRIETMREIQSDQSISPHAHDAESSARLDRHAMAAVLDERITSTESELAAMRHDLGETEGKLAAVQREYDSLTQSLSWRAIGPLRSLRRIARRRQGTVR
jgi:hypothetical protein